MLELQNDFDRVQFDLDEAQAENTKICQQNMVLIEQIRNFEQESFEIQMRIKKGHDIEHENKSHGEAISSLRDTERDLKRQVD